MAYYNSYGQYQQVQTAAPVSQYSYVSTGTPANYSYPSGYSSGYFTQAVGPSNGLAGYGGASSYKVNAQPVPYQQPLGQQSGRSFSTASDSGNNNEQCVHSQTLPVTGYTSYTPSGYGYAPFQQVEQYYYHQTQITHHHQHPGTVVLQQKQTTSQHGSQSQHSMSQPSQSGQQSFSNAQLTEPVQTCEQNDQLATLEPQIEAAYLEASTQRRQPVIKRQVITVPGSPGRVQQVVRRLPTPTPDIIERVFVVKPQRDVINLVIERPGTPPAQYKDRTVMGKQRRPLIHPRIVRVPARSQFQQLQYQPQYLQALPAPSPIYNVQSQQTPRVPTSCSYQYSQTPEQPALSQLSQGQLSSTEISQASDSQLGSVCQNQSMQSQSQTQQSKTNNGYVVASLAYGNDESSCVPYMPVLTGQTAPCVNIQPSTASYMPTDPYGVAYAAAVSGYMSQVAAPQLTYYGYQAPVARYY